MEQGVTRRPLVGGYLFSLSDSPWCSTRSFVCISGISGHRMPDCGIKQELMRQVRMCGVHIKNGAFELATLAMVKVGSVTVLKTSDEIRHYDLKPVSSPASLQKLARSWHRALWVRCNEAPPLHMSGWSGWSKDLLHHWGADPSSATSK
jgi:hypothetical protein